MIIHFSHYSSQPSVWVACSPEGFNPWGGQVEGRPGVFMISPKCDDFYTFDVRHVTCPECMMTDAFKEAKQRNELFLRAMKETCAKSEEEYVEMLKKQMFTEYGMKGFK